MERDKEMKQIYHHYTKWEDYKFGMYRRVGKKEEQELLKVAIEFTGDHIRYGEAMQEVVEKWVLSSEHNLTDMNINQRAWVGHAAACFKMNLPEYIVRMAWGYLTKDQQDKANNMADKAIEIWKKKQQGNILNLLF